MEYVNHPKYGNSPISSNEHCSLGEIRSAHWRYGSLKVFPETAIKADVSKQNYAMYPRGIYVDIEETCESCSRKFIFFAREQQYWFEELNFYIDSHCKECFECRKVSQKTKRLQKLYQQLKETPHRTQEQKEELESIAMELYKLGFIKNEQLLRVGKGS